MTLQQRVLKMGVSCNHTIIQVPSNEPAEKDEGFKEYPHLQFQDDGSLIIDGVNFHVTQSKCTDLSMGVDSETYIQSNNPAQCPKGVLTRDEYYLQLFSKWTGNSVDSMVAGMKLADDLNVNILPTTQASWATAAAGFIEGKFNPQTYGRSGKLDDAREAADREGAFTIGKVIFNSNFYH